MEAADAPPDAAAAGRGGEDHKECDEEADLEVEHAEHRAVVTVEAVWADYESPAMVAAGTAYHTLCDARGDVSGVAVRRWVDDTYRGVPKPLLRRAWEAADGGRKGRLTENEFLVFAGELERLRRADAAGAPADGASTKVAAAAAVGAVVAGPPGAAVFGGVVAGYEWLGRRVSSATAAAGQAAVATGVAGMLVAGPPGAVAGRAGQESEIPNFKGSFLGRFPLVSADFWTSDHLLERSRRVGAFSGTRARGTLTLKRR